MPLQEIKRWEAQWELIISRLDRRYRRVTAALISMVVVELGLLVFVVAQARDTSTFAARNTTALCALRTNLRHRVDDSQTFLLHHPRGAFGITPGQILKSIADTRETLIALSTIDCPPRPPNNVSTP
jgi:hypothetical protein